jgi:hypothetical protein
MVRQFFAGAIILALTGGLGYYFWPAQETLCPVCQRPIHKATSYYVTLGDGRTVELCCPRCGLRFQQNGGDVRSVRVTDFDSGKLLNPEAAIYVEGSSVHPCCTQKEILKDHAGTEYERTWDRCLPSVIAFASKQAALKFQSEQGGELRTHEEIMAEVQIGAY